MPQIEAQRWTGSLVTGLDKEDLVPGDFRSLKNFIYDQAGFPTVRGGRRIYNSTAIQESGIDSAVQGLYHYRAGWVSGLYGDWVVAYAGTKVYKSEGDAVFDEILSGLQRDLTPSFATLRGQLILATGSETLPHAYFWESGMASMGRLEKAPPARIVASHASRLWIVDRDQPSKLWFSAPFEPNNWQIVDGAGFLQIGPGDGGSISALVPGFAGEMIVFKDSPSGGSTYRIQGLGQPFSVYPLSTTIGAVSHTMASQVGDKDVFFGSRRGLHSLRRVFEHGDLETQFVDYESSGRWRSLSDRNKAKAIAFDDYPNDTWWVFVDTDNDGINDAGWLFNYRHSSPRGYPRLSDMDFGAASGVVYRDPSSGRERTLTGGYNGRVYAEHNPEARDESTPGTLSDFTWEAHLAPIDGGDRFALKGWGDLTLRQDNWGLGEMTVSWFGDNHPPRSSTMDLNSAGARLPYYETRMNEFRGFPPKYVTTNRVYLREGGVDLNLRFNGTAGRIRLKSFRLSFVTRRSQVTSKSALGYTSTQTPVRD